MNALYWVAFRTLIHKEVVRFTRIWVQTLVPPAITMSLYFIIFGNLIGSRIGEMEGFTYMEYIVPGLIMMSVITNSYSNVASSFFSAKFQHNIEELLVAPIPNYVIIAGYIGGGMCRGLAVGALVTMTSLFCRLANRAPSDCYYDRGADVGGVCAGGINQCYLRQNLRRYKLDPNLCPHAIDLFRRGLLLAITVARVLAGRVKTEPDCVYG